LLASVLVPGSRAAADPEAPISLEVPSLARRDALPPKKLQEPNKCSGILLAGRGGAPAFMPGEELSYDLSTSGLDIGRLELKVGRPRTWNGHPALPLFARARTHGFASTVKAASGRWMSLVDPASMRPLALRVESTYGADQRHEQVRFDKKAMRAKSEFLYEGKTGTRDFEDLTPVFDVLSLLYFARTRALSEGTAACQDVFGDRRMWRLEAKVQGVKQVATPAGDKPTHLVTTVFESLPHPDMEPGKPVSRIELDLYFADDESQAPLAFEVRTKKMTARGELKSWTLRGRGDEKDWEL
jgi:hypothetical protein